MKYISCAIATAVMLLSVTTAVSLSQVYEAPQELENRRLLAASGINAKISELKSGPYGEEFERFFEIFQVDYSKYYEAFGVAFGDISRMCEATQGFNSTYAKEIRKLATAAGMRWSLEIYTILYNEITENTPMPQVAVIVNKFINHGAGTVNGFKRSIYRLIEKENPDVLPGAESIYSFAEEVMNVAFNPTIEYLEPFMPTQ